MSNKKQGQHPPKRQANRSNLIDIYQKSDVLLGKGGMATVYLGGYAPDEGDPNVMFAIKQVQIKGKLQQSGLDEINLLRKLRHPNIVRFIDARKHQNSMYLILEACIEGNLQKLIMNNRPHQLGEAGILRLFAQIVMGMMFLQEKKIIHRDIKPSNILMQDSRPKIADFGVAKRIDKYKQNITFEGTNVYMSPQMLKQENYSSLTDMWSLGVTLYFMVFKTQPWIFTKNNHILLNEIIKKVNQQTVVPEQNITPELRKMIMKMLVIKEEERMTWNELYNHELLKDCIKEYEKEEDWMEQSNAETEEIKIEQFIKFNTSSAEEKVEKRGKELSQMYRASKLRVDYGLQAYRKICRFKERCKFLKRILMDLKEYRKQQVVEKHKHLFIKCHFLLAKRSYILSKDLNHITLLKSNHEGIIDIPEHQFNEFMQDAKYTKKLNEVRNAADDLFKYNRNEWDRMRVEFNKAVRLEALFKDNESHGSYINERMEEDKDLIKVFNVNFLELFLHLSKPIVETYSNALHLQIEKSKFLAEFHVDIMFVYDLIVLLCFHNLDEKANFETYYEKRDFASIQEIVFRIITAHKAWLI